MDNLEEAVTIPCMYCDSRLNIPKKVYGLSMNMEIDVWKRQESIKRELDSTGYSAAGFFASPYGSFYCNEECYRYFLED